VVKLRPRLVPSVILAATILLGLKVSDIFSVGSHALAQATSPNQATGAPIDLTSLANAAKVPEPTPAAEKPQAPPAEKQLPPAPPAPQATAAQQTTTPQAQAAGSAPQPATPQKQASSHASALPVEATKAAPADDAKPVTQTAEAPAPTGDAKPPIKDPLLLSPAEIEVLQELSVRRAQLDRRAGEIDQQQVVLQAAEKRIDEKIAKLEAIQKSVQAIVDKQNAADDARTQSLVKIYETMKPADAAQILSQLDMPILLQMLSRMKEAKTAPILAAMDPTKAEAITTAMAKRQNPPSVALAPAAPSAKP
jgi:flagellar motility protein MotE (MotC chaperone)